MAEEKKEQPEDVKANAPEAEAVPAATVPPKADSKGNAPAAKQERDPEGEREWAAALWQALKPNVFDYVQGKDGDKKAAALILNSITPALNFQTLRVRSKILDVECGNLVLKMPSAGLSAPSQLSIDGRDCRGVAALDIHVDWANRHPAQVVIRALLTDEKGNVLIV